MKASTAAIFKFIQEHNGEILTNDYIADATGYSKRQVAGVVSMSICNAKPPRGEREIVLVQDEAGNEKEVQIVKLNDIGMAFDVDANAAPAE